VLRVLFVGLPVLVFITGIPLALRLVPPNRWYGFRTAATLSSPEAWYPINAATGVALVAAGALGGIVVLLLSQGVIALKPTLRYALGMLLTALFMLASLIPVVLYANRF
jgi:hypothetical protein